MQWITQLTQKRAPWLLLAGFALGFELIALYFQYVMALEPCIMCIYQRVAMWGVFISALVGAAKPQNTIVRALGLAGFVISSGWGFLVAKEHIMMQTTTDPFAFSCAFEPNFPSFMPLHEWIPSLFAATGDCGNIDWQFLGLSMPGWMQVIFAAMSAVSIVLVLALTLKKR